jgi:hypothetical protein
VEGFRPGVMKMIWRGTKANPIVELTQLASDGGVHYVERCAGASGPWKSMSVDSKAFASPLRRFYSTLLLHLHT